MMNQQTGIPGSTVSRTSTDPPPTPMNRPGPGSDPVAQARFARRAPWVADSQSLQCMLCAENFGLTKRRHHCRACGNLVCHECSKNSSRVVPGYEPEAVRICRPCFVHNYAILIVWHSWFSYSDKMVSGEDKAMQVFSKLNDDSSRIMVRMNDGCVLNSWYKNEQWQSRIVNRVQAQRRELMAQPHPYQVPPPSDYVQPSQDSVFIPRGQQAPPVQQQQQQQQQQAQLPPGPPPPSYGPNGYPVPLFVNSQVSERGAVPGSQVPPTSQPPSLTRTHQTNSTFLNCFIAYRNKSKQDPLMYSWIDVRSEPDMPEMLQLVKGIVEKAGVVQAALVFAQDARVHYVFDSEGLQEDFAPEAQQACQESTVVVAWQVMDGSQMTRIVKWSEVPQVVAHLDKRLPSVVLSMHGNILSYRNCSVSTLDVISRTAGAAVVSGNVVVVATAIFDRPDSVRLFDSALLAHKEIRDNEGGLLFACMKTADGPEGYTVSLMAAHPAIDLTEALVQFQAKISEMLDATKNGVSGAETCATPSAATAGGEGGSRTKNGHLVTGPFSQADADEEARKELLSCPICIEPYTVDARKPCICGGCGNSICHGCISSLRHCPYCRHEYSNAQKSITNIALLALVEASTTIRPPVAGGTPTTSSPLGV